MRCIPVLFFMLCASLALGQPQAKKEKEVNYRFRPDEKRQIVNLQVTYDLQYPSGDMAKRFGSNSSLGTGCFVKTNKNWVWGGEFGYMFSSHVKENSILDSLSNSNGYIIGLNGSFAKVSVSERGYFILGKFGKVIPLMRRNKNSGFMLYGGPGFMQHKIRISVPDNNIGGLTKEYRKGYDRLTNGLLLNGFAGFYYVDRRRFINFYAGYNVMYGMTKNRRDWNFDTMMKDDTKRKDVLSGFRFGWIIPIYPSNKNDEFIFY